MERLTKTTGPDGKEFTPCSLCYMAGSAVCKVIKDKSTCWEMEVYERLAEYEDTDLTPEVCANYKAFEDEAISKGVTFARIVELMEADKDGRVVVLPCKAGDTLWTYCTYPVERAYKTDVTGVSVVNGEVFINTSGPKRIISVSDIGRTVFRTREEAEKKLETMRNG